MHENKIIEKDIFGELNMEIYNNDILIDTIKVDVGESEKEWFFLGSYAFSKGNTALILADKSDGSVVYADAVKWVKR